MKITTRATVGFAVFVAVGYLSVIGLVIYVAQHFIRKWW